MTLLNRAVPTARLVHRLRYRELLRHLIVRNLKIKYQRSLLGFVWTLLNPILTIAVMLVVFGYILRIPVPAYWAFLLSSYLVWNFVMLSLSSATAVLAEHSSLLRSVAVPAEILVLGSVASRFVEFTIELGFALLVLILFHHHGVPGSLALVPLLVTFQFALTLGLVLPLAILSVFYEDVRHVLPVFLLLLFYVSPVFYPVSVVPESLKRFYPGNPIASLLTLFHDTLYEGRWPSPELIGWTALVSGLVLFAGYRLFRRYRSTLPEIL